ncbi:MAG: DUF2062 domain-containing protein [Pseudomonadota bacterium]|nr:DUF2062 domain-containing protein [Pseudomonadota bacterium]
MFKRKPRSYTRAFTEFFYPRGGWYRASRYVIHRLRRLPDPADRIARGIAAGVFVSFTPLFGLHFLTAALIAWIVRGNLLAAILSTFVGNPITFPFIAGISLRLGNRFLGLPPRDTNLTYIVDAFARASHDIWHNFLSIFTHETAEWAGLALFLDRVFLPYLVGGILPGIAAAMIAFGLSRPVITAYQKRRVKQLRKRYEKRMAERANAKEGET